MFRKRAPAFLLLVVLAAALLYWLVADKSQPEAGLVHSDPQLAMQNPETGSAISAEVLEEEDSPVMQSPARRIRHGVAAEQEEAGAKEPNTEPISPRQERLNNRVESALEGNIDDLVAITRLVTTCARGYSNEEELQRMLDRMARFGDSGGGRSMFAGRAGPGGPGGAINQQSTPEEREAAMWSQFDQCQSSKDVLNEDLQEEIARLAEAGQPSARYLYAIWPPYDSVFDLVDSLELLEYQSLALEYTWMNLQQRDPLGVLAMSQSYGTRPSGLFTPANRVQSQVFLLASMQCGIDNEWLSNRAVNFGQGFSRFQASNTEIPDLDADAAAVAEMFCPLPQAD